MQITTVELMAEAREMALEVRLKDKAISQLEAENKALREHNEQLRGIISEHDNQAAVAVQEGLDTANGNAVADDPEE